MAKKNIRKNSISTIIDGLHITVTTNNIHIEDSYTVVKRVKMRTILDTLEKYLKESNITMDTPFNHRSINSMVNEWVGHNNLFTLHLFESRTTHVDLQVPVKWYEPIVWWLLSRIAL